MAAATTTTPCRYRVTVFPLFRLIPKNRGTNSLVVGSWCGGGGDALATEFRFSFFVDDALFLRVVCLYVGVVFVIIIIRWVLVRAFWG